MMYYNYLGVFSEMNQINAAYTIQKNWRERRYNPKYKLCYKVEMSNIDAICIEYGIGSKEELEKQTPDFKNKLLKYRKLDFQEELNKIKERIKTVSFRKERVIIKGRRKKNV